MSPDTPLLAAVYLLTVITLVVGLKLMAVPGSARQGRLLAALGIVAAVTATLLVARIERFEYILAALILGPFIGFRLAKRASGTNPATLFNGFGGLAALLAAWAEFHAHPAGQGWPGAIALWVAAVAGGTAFSGSLTMGARLGKKRDVPDTNTSFGFRLPARVLLIALPLFGVLFSMDTVAPEAGRWFALFVMAALSLGFLWAASLRDGDLGAALAVSNACTGLAVSALGFVFQNALLVAAGALLASGGVALALDRCKASNRPLSAILPGGFGN